MVQMIRMGGNTTQLGTSDIQNVGSQNFTVDLWYKLDSNQNWKMKLFHSLWDSNPGTYTDENFIRIHRDNGYQPYFNVNLVILFRTTLPIDRNFDDKWNHYTLTRPRFRF